MDDPNEKREIDPETEMKEVPLEKAEDEASPTGSASDNAGVEKLTSPSFQDDPSSYSFVQRRAAHMAKDRNPCIYFWVAFVVSIAISLIGLIVGNFAVAVDNAGWQSRGTLIADRHTQFMLAYEHRYALFSDTTGEVWRDLIENVQPGWESVGDDDSVAEGSVTTRALKLQDALNQPWIGLQPAKHQKESTRRLPFAWTPPLQRKLQTASTANDGGILDGCSVDWYTSKRLTDDTHLWPVWRTKENKKTASLLEASHIRDICLAEEITQQTLVEEGLCFGCPDNRCLPPYSLVLFARLSVENGLGLSCDQLGEAWGDYFTAQVEQELLQCVQDIRTFYQPERDGSELPDSCPSGFSPVLIDEFYDSKLHVEFSSSIFATGYDMDGLFANVQSYSRGVSNLVEGAYDTQYEDFVELQIDDSLANDMMLALGSAVITVVAILVHTRSPFLSVVGLLQIILSFPLSFFVYTFIGGLEFFPFLNFIGIFVVFALGADDIFVAVDKWKNARVKLGMDAETTAVAAAALPDAAGSMFLTTLTTAVAFFGTAICPVAPIKCFATFCGLLIMFDYIMCVLLVFPALCIYDKSRHSRSCCCRCHCCHKSEAEGHVDADHHIVVDKPSLIRRLLTRFYDALHMGRWALLLVCAAAIILSIVFASKIGLPTSSDVRLLDESTSQYEANYQWRLKLLYEVLVKKSGSTAYVMWGVKPADTGDVNNPQSWSQLVLDESFDPSSEDSQVYMRDFCDRLFENDWAERTAVDYECPMNLFDSWLQVQSNSSAPDAIYVENCGGAVSLPVQQNDFDACIYAWGQQVVKLSILAREGKVQVMFIPFRTRVRYDSPFDDLNREWKDIEIWLDSQVVNGAPEGASQMFHTSETFWWYDTNGSMLNTAYTAAAIAIGTGALVILFSSRSIVLTIFSAVTIGYVLASVTATLVALGWTLGFLESICFAILIGISCDFVIHFTHAYSMLPGSVDRGQRTKHALLEMGPSILAAAFTTIAGATVMLFTVISFFEKFAVVLFLTIIQATAGSFIVFLVLTDCFGPAEPTYTVDLLWAKCRTFCGKDPVLEVEKDPDHNTNSSGFYAAETE